MNAYKYKYNSKGSNTGYSSPRSLDTDTDIDIDIDSSGENSKNRLGRNNRNRNNEIYTTGSKKKNEKNNILCFNDVSVSEAAEARINPVKIVRNLLLQGDSNASITSVPITSTGTTQNTFQGTTTTTSKAEMDTDTDTGMGMGSDENDKDSDRDTHRPATSFIIYQTRNAHTGGTVALEMLHQMLQQVGINSLLCDDKNWLKEECRRYV